MYHRRVKRVLAAALALAASASVVEAQRVMSSVDVAGASLWYADSLRAMGSTISPAFSVDWPRATIAAAGTLSRLDNNGGSAQGSLAPSLFTPQLGPLTFELAGALGGSTHRDGTRTGQMLGTLRGHLMSADRGAWIGGGAGRTWDGAIWRSVRLAEAGAWLQRQGTVALATVSPVVVNDSIHYADLQASMRYRAGNVELGLSAGARAGEVASALGGTTRAWGSVSVTNWLHSNVALVASAGSYPVDFTQGYPGGRFATLALRFAARSGGGGGGGGESDQGSPARRVSTELMVGLEQTKASGVTELAVANTGGNGRTIRVRARDAQRVELAGDFTAWRPVLLDREADGWWTTTLSIEPGTYQMNVRVNGGVWIAPPGLTAVADEFGAVVGVLPITKG
jgi:hypothetical protein